MLKRIVYRLLRRRHFWRAIGFDELSELYISSMLRAVAVTLLMVFVPFYLYQQGYSIAAIFVTFGSFFVTRVAADFMAGHLVARFGPKHTMLLSCFLQIVSAGLFLSVPAYQWPTWLLGIPWGASASCYFIAYHVEFSKIRHTDHAGKELGYMHIMEKIGAVVGPLLGGLAGTFLGAQYIFLVAAFILLGSLVPLFRTAEPTKTRQKLNFKDFPLQKVLPDVRAYAALGVENTLCINLWSLYLALFALQSQVYAKLGALNAVAIITSIASARLIGKLIDVRSGRMLLRRAAVANALLYALRPFVHSLFPALMVNIANETVTTAYRMPFLKGVYAAADDLPGFRIVYIVTLEATASIVKAAAWFLLAILALGFSAYSVILVGFVVAAVGSLLITSEQFKALSPRHIMGGKYA